MVYKPTYNWGAPSCIIQSNSMGIIPNSMGIIPIYIYWMNRVYLYIYYVVQ